MEHYKSRSNDYFHFTNPHDDVSEFNDDDDDVYDESQYYDVDDDRSCDFNFHTYLPLRDNRPSFANSQTTGVMNLVDAVKLGDFDNGALIFQLDNSMKNISDKLQHAIEGIGTQISRVEEETWKLDNVVQDVKNSEEGYHRMTHQKLLQMHGILQEVQDGVLFLRDNHEIAETQRQLAILRNSVLNKINTSPESSCNTPFGNQQSNEPTLSQAVSYYPLMPPQAHELTAQRYDLPPNHQPHISPLKKSDRQFPHFVQSQVSDTSFIQISNYRNYKSAFHDTVLLPVESFGHSQEKSTRINYNYSPTHLTETPPYALPIAIDVKEESRFEGNRNTIPVDDVVDKVTGMGFRRDHVTANVRKLALNGSKVDLNSVLDKMMKNR